MKPFRRRVTFDDVDFAHVPFFGRYFSWVSEALNQNGLAYTELLEHRGIGFPIVDARCHYHRPLAIDQEFDVTSRFATSPLGDSSSRSRSTASRTRSASAMGPSGCNSRDYPT